MTTVRQRILKVIALLIIPTATLGLPSDAGAAWSIGAPIVNYWAGPGWPAWNWNPPSTYTPLTDSNAQQMVDVGMNLVWATSQEELDIAQKYGLRAMWGRTFSDTNLNRTISVIRRHPALYSYFLYDEPSAKDFPWLSQMAADVRALDPDRMSYINLFPNYATPTQLGAGSYIEHLDQFVSSVQPALLSYDHYQFYTSGDSSGYLQNLMEVSQKAKSAGLPFMNIVQLSSWTPGVRVTTPNEARYLVYSTLAYGAQAVSYYLWSFPGNNGGFINPTNGQAYPVYNTLKAAHREFVTIAEQVQNCNYIWTYLKGYSFGHMPPGTYPLPNHAPFDIASVSNTLTYTNLAPLKGVLFGFFAPNGNTLADARFAIIANLDTTATKTYTVTGQVNISVFDATARRWMAMGQKSATVNLAPGGGVLVGVTSSITDSNPPVGTTAYSFVPRFGARITFNEPVDISRASFGIDGGSLVTNAILQYDNKSVWLKVSNGLPSPQFTVSFTNVMDWTGNAVTNSVVGVNDGYTLTDISNNVPGQLTAFSPTNFTLTAQGSVGEGQKHDSLPFAYKAVTGDFDLRLQIVDIRCAQTWVAWGLMIRNSTDSGSPCLYVGTYKSGVNYWLVQSRTASNAAMNTVSISPRSTNAQPPNTWVRLKRSGNTLTSYSSSNGLNWDLLATVTNMPLTDTKLIGICGSSADNTRVSTVQYANFGPTFPTLQIESKGENATIKWSARTDGRLQTTSQLAAPWTEVTNARVSIGNQTHVTVPIDYYIKYFRLEN